MYRSEVIDLGALRRNVRTLRDVAAPAELWAVVKADAYGHGAREVARACLEDGAAALCVATAREGADLRATAPDARVVVMSPVGPGEDELAREAGLELPPVDALGLRASPSTSRSTPAWAGGA